MHLSLQHGCTALMKAYDRGHMECVKMLLDRGAQVNRQDKVSGVIDPRKLYPLKIHKML